MTKSVSKFITGSFVAAALLLSLSLPSPARAQGRHARAVSKHLDRMQNQEQAQIRKGVKDGSLTKAQAQKLESGMDGIEANVAKDKASGKLTPQEAQQIKNQTKQEEKAIRKAEDFNKDNTPSPTPQQ